MAAYTMGTYTSPYAQKLQELYGQIENRRNEEFNYDYTSDPNYKSMRKTALLDAQQSAADTLGKTSALTGGRSSTEAVRAAAQAGNNAKATLNNAVPSLYENAYNKWRNYYADMLSEYSVLQSNENTDYSRWLEAETAKSNEEQTNYNRQQSETQYADTLKQQHYNNLVSLIGSTGYTPTETELLMSGMTAEAAAALRAEYLRQVALQEASGSGGSGGGGGSSGGGTEYSYEDVRDSIMTAANSGNYSGATQGAKLAKNEGLINQSQYSGIVSAISNTRANNEAKAGVSTLSSNAKSFVSTYKSWLASGKATQSSVTTSLNTAIRQGYIKSSEAASIYYALGMSQPN